MLRDCPHHGLEKWLMIHTFYNGINYQTKVSFDSAIGGALMNKGLDEAEDIIESVAQNHHQWASKRSSGAIKIPRKYSVDALDLITAKLNSLSRQFENLNSHLEKKEEEITIEVEKISLATEIQIVPFPQRLLRAQKDVEFEKFLEKIKEICIDIPLLDALHQMAKFSKFMKDIISNKRKKGGFEIVTLTEEVSGLLLNVLPPKLQDPGSFSIPYKIKGTIIDKAFCDLGASVSLMPYSMCKKLGLSDLKLTSITLQLDDSTCRYPLGIVEDAKVKIGNFVIPIDFVVLDMDEDPKITIILGRPFLATAGANIDVKNHQLSLKVCKEELIFNLSPTSPYPSFETTSYSFPSTFMLIEDDHKFREDK
ncbi:uncharacterized protein LOC122026634 [Zingiber officinale]|uniref:uncharacterized protein LOC122026634 n=1 Tax=Zingiber officinale TaxID=94328 RepID=UPI001C4C20BD|nr:uncharacterized protein LOC122026634 [Zingiber officinale]